MKLNSLFISDHGRDVGHLAQRVREDGAGEGQEGEAEEVRGLATGEEREEKGEQKKLPDLLFRFIDAKPEATAKCFPNCFLSFIPPRTKVGRTLFPFTAVGGQHHDFQRNFAANGSKRRRQLF